MSQIDCRLYETMCALLFDDWDPIGVNSYAPRDEYDSYAAGLIRLIQDGADEFVVTRRLGELARVNMCLSHVEEEQDRTVARRLIALVRGT